MNKKAKQRLGIVTGIIVIVAIALFAFVGGNSSAKTMTIDEALAADQNAGKIKVTGNVVPNSYSIDGSELTFSIYNPDSDPEKQLVVVYDGGMAPTFGNDISAICTGRIAEDGSLSCSELVTKCPSKYESSNEALSISKYLEYGDSVIDKPIKIQGILVSGSLAPAGNSERFVIGDPDTADHIGVIYNGALPEDLKDGDTLVLFGSLDKSGMFAATDVALSDEN